MQTYKPPGQRERELAHIPLNEELRKKLRSEEWVRAIALQPGSLLLTVPAEIRLLVWGACLLPDSEENENLEKVRERTNERCKIIADLSQTSRQIFTDLEDKYVLRRYHTYYHDSKCTLNFARYAFQIEPIHLRSVHLCHELTDEGDEQLFGGWRDMLSNFKGLQNLTITFTQTCRRLTWRNNPRGPVKALEEEIVKHAPSFLAGFDSLRQLTFRIDDDLEWLWLGALYMLTKERQDELEASSGLELGVRNEKVKQLQEILSDRAGIRSRIDTGIAWRSIKIPNAQALQRLIEQPRKALFERERV